MAPEARTDIAPNDERARRYQRQRTSNTDLRL
jgi:hypothetical protein